MIIYGVNDAKYTTVRWNHLTVLQDLLTSRNTVKIIGNPKYFIQKGKKSNGTVQFWKVPTHLEEGGVLKLSLFHLKIHTNKKLGTHRKYGYIDCNRNISILKVTEIGKYCFEPQLKHHKPPQSRYIWTLSLLK